MTQPLSALSLIACWPNYEPVGRNKMDNTNPLVSILVPAYNAAAYLPELCRSIQAQTFSDYEVLILDDGSTDDTGILLSSYEKLERFRIFRWKENRGLNAAQRKLLNLMRGEFWVSPGTDDVFAAEFLERRVLSLRARPEAVITHGAAHIIDESGKQIPSPFAQLNLPSETNSDRALGVLLQHNIINQPSALVRSAVTRRVLPFFQFDWKYAPDWHLWILHLAAGGSLLWDAQPLHQYRAHGASLSLDPAKGALRSAEIRLVPLCALSAAAKFSGAAAEYWRKWQRTLYCLWLRRACKLWRQPEWSDSWMERATEAYYGGGGKPRILSEILKHAPQIALTTLREKQARRRQAFAVSGVAEIDDPVFR